MIFSSVCLDSIKFSVSVPKSLFCAWRSSGGVIGPGVGTDGGSGNLSESSDEVVWVRTVVEWEE